MTQTRDDCVAPRSRREMLRHHSLPSSGTPEPAELATPGPELVCPLGGSTPTLGPGAPPMAHSAQRVLDLARKSAHARVAALVVEDAAGGLVEVVLSAREPIQMAELRVALASSGDDRVAAITALAALATTSPADHDAPVGSAELAEVSLRVGPEGRLHLYLIGRGDDGTFTPSEKKLARDILASTFALPGGAAAAVDAREREVEQQRATWLRAALALSQQLLDACGSDSDPLTTVAGTVLDLAEACTVTVLTPFADVADQLQVSANAGLDAGSPGPDAARLCELRQAVLRTGRGRLLTPEMSSPGYGFDGDALAGRAMAVSLRGEGSERGVIEIRRSFDQPCFTDAELEMAEDFAHEVAIALELSESMVTEHRLGVLEDRQRIARDLHDQVIQRLFATGLRLQSTAAVSTDPASRTRVTEAITELNDTVRQIRTAIFGLERCDTSAHTPRRVLLELVDSVGTAFGLRCDVQFRGPVDILIDGGVLDDLEAVVREALTNTGKHAQATSAKISVSATPDRLELVCQDDGIGLGGSSRCSGMGNLRARAECRGGTLQVDQPAGSGVRLRWAIPLS